MIQKKQITEQQALRKLAGLCARSEHSEGEIREKMRNWNLSDEATQRVLNELTEQHYIDDARFTRFFVHDKIRYNKWGRWKIEQALWQKRISEDIAHDVFDQVDDQEYIQVLAPLLKSKFKTIKAKTDYERSMKLIKFAMGRGFEMELIRKCIDNEIEEYNI